MASMILYLGLPLTCNEAGLFFRASSHLVLI